MKELEMHEMEKATGGYVVRDEKEDKFWVVAQDGSVIAPAPSEALAMSFAKTLNVSSTVMTLDEYKNMFGRELKW